VYASNLCGHFRLDFWSLAGAARGFLEAVLSVDGMRITDPADGRWFAAEDAVYRLPVWAGKLDHAVLKAAQRIRGLDDAEAARRAVAVALYGLTFWLQGFLALDGDLDLFSVVLPVAEKVMQRRWRERPIDGGEAR